jgi:hypothetical protein
VPAKKARKARKATRSRRPTIRPTSAAPITDAKVVRALTPRAVFAGAICVMAAAVLIAARQPSQQPEVASISAPPTAMPPEEIAPPKPSAPPVAAALSAASVSTEPAAATTRLETKKSVPSKPTAAVVRASGADTSVEKAGSAEARVAAAEPVSSAPKTDTTVPKAAAMESTSNVAGLTVTSVTITGCVANDEATFWLKDTSGADAPKSRNWKSGFLKKRPAPIELLDATHALRLPNYVGQRVAATGTLVNREMRAHSLQRVATSCS